MPKPRIALIATGGTIAAIGRGPLDLIDYGANKTMLHAEDLLERVPEARDMADVIAVPYRNIPSYEIGFAEWKELGALCRKLEDDPALAGIVISHGTASLEETAFFLHLTLKTTVPVVLVAAQRPLSGLSSDAQLNLVNALRVASDPASRGLGVLVVLNDEIHSARDVTKTSTFRLYTFRSPDFGPIGYADADRVYYVRKPARPHTTETEFAIAGLDALPRVDIAYSYVGSDGTAIRAFTQASAAGIVMAGFAPGLIGRGDEEALLQAAAAGVTVIQASRGGSGRTLAGTRLRELGFIGSEDFNPQKSRLLLQLALTLGSERGQIDRIFSTY